MLSAYIHLPFCTHKCPFCDFAAFAGLSRLEDKYVDVLIDEINFKVKNIKPSLHTVSFGGGTPSLTSFDNLNKIMGVLHTKFNFTSDMEISLEATPHSLTREKLSQLKQLGINRLSIGVQSFNDDELKAINRDHTSLQAVEAIDLASQSGFTNINIDLMYGLPTQDLKSFKRSFDKLMNLSMQYDAIRHFSLYGLTLEGNSPFYKIHPKLSPNYPSDDESIKMYKLANNVAPDFGFERYEISNFAKPGYISRHNLNYWELGEFYGFGVGSYQYINNWRSSNTKNINKYLNDFKNLASHEEITYDIKVKESIMLGLRLKEGINLDEFHDKFNYDLTSLHSRTIDNLQRNGYIIKQSGNLSLTVKGLVVSNLVIEEFF